MNTPSHLLLNEALLGSRPARRARAVLAGAVLPDAPIYLFWAYERLLLRVPEALVWRRDYAASAAQPLIDALHSFPLILAALALSWLRRRELATALSASLLLHAAADLPLHHADAHRQFFPLSDYRFQSPVSYWDPRYHGKWGALAELAAALAAAVVLVRRHEDWRARAAWVGVALLDLVPYVYWR